MNVVGIDRTEWCDDDVHTIDLWYSDRRRCWIVERLNVDGHLVGTGHCCTTMHDAEACLSEWLRLHDEAHITSPKCLDVVADDLSDEKTLSPSGVSNPSNNARRHAA